jgi:hypothetical protein
VSSQDTAPTDGGARRLQVMTGPGRPAAQPDGAYEPAPAVRAAPAGLEVHFTGEDDRSQTFSCAALPLPTWHADLTITLARCTGPTGTMRTLASARHAWQLLARFVRFLDGLPNPPRDAAALTVAHLRQFTLHRTSSLQQAGAIQEGRALRRLLRELAAAGRLRPEVVEWLEQRQPNLRRRGGKPGYSDQEFRQIMAAARRDVVAIRDRIRAGGRLLEVGQRAPHTLDPGQRAIAAALAQIAATGEVPIPPGERDGPSGYVARLRLAGRLFLLDGDLAPLLLLGVGLSGRNGETIKELPAHHELLDGRVVAVELIKRRRGVGNTHQRVHWEIGPPSRQLHTPGGYYLLVHELAARGRAFTGAKLVWSIWNIHRGHLVPFQQRLHWYLGLNQWVRRHGLRDDDGQPLRLTLNRLKTTVEVRTTRAAGGHLPSAVRTNTMDVLFDHYLRGDPTVQEWAADEVTAALHDAEHHAHQAHLRVLAGPSETTHDPVAAAGQLGVDPAIARQALDGGLDTSFAACLDHDHSPFNDGPCQASFLSCLRCPNALVTHRHLPSLAALLERLEADRQSMDADAWWRRHGRAWLAITEEVLPKFTPAEVEQARATRPDPALLDLLDGPREPQ